MGRDLGVGLKTIPKNQLLNQTQKKQHNIMPTLHWIGKEKVINHHRDVPYRVLQHQYGFTQTQQSKTPTNAGNKIIHGDNLEALKSLLPEYEGRIKCIYIDPPYNTGNEKWVYNDNVNHPKIKKWLNQVVGKDGEDLTRHDKWLCMMYPRLKLLHKLLADDGAIFISIDDNEQAHLKLMCDEIFGGNNFVTTISWFKKVSPSNDAKWFSNDHEFILIYSKQKSFWHPKKLKLNDKQTKYYKNPDNDPRGNWNSSTYTCNKTKIERPNLYYPIINPNTKEKIYPKETAVWAYSQELHKKHTEDNLIYWGKDGKAKPRFKKFLNNHQGVVPRTIWQYEDTGHTQEATQELRKVMGNVFFSTPKPPRLIERVLKLATDKDSIILDSFAGSGTTAHAVLNLNKADGGTRQFILIEMEDYAETITAERVKRVIKGYGEGKQAVSGTGGSFDYYELGESLFTAEGYLNESLSSEQIRSYVWHSETQSELQTHEHLAGISAYYLGNQAGVAYYFYYEKDSETTLDYDSLSIIHELAEQYIVYADNCTLPLSFMQERHIIFKKIPRDISRF